MIRLDDLICVGAFAVLAACGGGGDGGDDGPGPDASMNEPLVNGVPASQYYGEFAHGKTMTGVNGAAAFPTTAEGRNAFLVHFFLMPNGKLELFYEEGEGEVTSTGWSLSTSSATKKHRSGMWKVEGAQLVLDSFMRCDGLLFNDKPALQCTLATPIVTPAAQGRSGRFGKMFGMASPDDTAFADYVP